MNTNKKQYRLYEIDSTYTNLYKKAVQKMTESKNKIFSSYKFNLGKKEVSYAIAARMKAWLDYQTDITTKIFIKHKKTSAADFFVECVTFFLTCYLEKTHSKLKVEAEYTSPAVKHTRFDIAILKGDKIKYVIECKTQLGWQRNNWYEDLKRRQENLKSKYPQARLFLLVATTKNWKYQKYKHELGKELFILLNDKWFDEFSFEDTSFLTPIENLLKKIK